MHLLRTIMLLAAAAALASCATRGPDSPKVLPPRDLAGVAWEESFRKLREREYQFPERDEYVIGPGDVLSFTLVGRQDILGIAEQDPEKSLEIKVTESPYVVLPHIGAIRVHGKTQVQLLEEVRRAYESVIRDPVPVLSIDEQHDNQVTVLGSVFEPGRHPLQPGETLVDSVFKAGGITMGRSGGDGAGGLPPARIVKVFREKLPRAERANLTIDELVARLSQDGKLSTREEIVVPFDDFIIRGQLTHNMPLVANDIVYVPPAGTVSVQGPFRNPRVVFLGPGLRLLSQVATECGGLKYKGASRVEIIRTNPDGTVESIYVNLRDIFDQKEPDIFLEDNDKVVAYINGMRALGDFLAGMFKGSVSTGANATYSPTP